MKYSLIFVAVLLVGCSKGSSVNVNPVSSPASSISFSKSFEGSIDKYPIRMELARNGSDLSGKYVYTRNDKGFGLKGTVDGQENLLLNEFDGEGNQTGVFKGRFTSAAEMQGTWAKPNGNSEMPFSLRERSTHLVDATSTATVPPNAVTGAELNREMVLALINQTIGPKEVFAHMMTSSNVLGNITPIYSQMIEAKVITCKQGTPSCGCWVTCRPTSHSEEYLRLETPEEGLVAGNLRMKIGWKSPTQVTGISKIDETSAIADYLVTYEAIPNIPYFPKYQSAFTRIDNRDNERHRAFLRKFDDGWRIERLN